MTDYKILRPKHSRAISSRFAVVAISVFGILVTGCGGSAEKSKFKKFERTDVSGSITFDGKPVPAGIVNFRNKETGNQAQFPIKDGKYKSDSGQGPQPGLNIVEVFGRETSDPFSPYLWAGSFKQEVTIEKPSHTGDITIPKDKVKPPGPPPKKDDGK